MGAVLWIQASAAAIQIVHFVAFLMVDLMNQEFYINSPGLVAEQPSGPPAGLKMIGITNIVVGALLAILNIRAIGNSIWVLGKGMPNKLSIMLIVNIMAFLSVGLLFVVGGSALVAGRRWGRTVSMLAVDLCFIAYLVSLTVSGVANGLLADRSFQPRMGSVTGASWVLIAVTFTYAIVVFSILLTPSIRNWAKRRGPFPVGLVRSTSVLAIVALACSLIPFVLSQIAALGLGIAALISIKNSDGRLRGNFMAIAGLVISSALLLFIASLLIYGYYA